MSKRILVILLALLVLAGIMVSCKNEVQAPAEELVSVSFDNDSSRALSASLEDFKPGDYFWKYAAKKADASNLISGQTAGYDTSASAREAGAQWIREGKAGFADDSGSYRVPGFSQGLWNFTLYGYKKIIGDNPATTETETEYYVLVYSGETTGVLLKSAEGYHTVSAVVSPVQGENGTLWVKVTGDDRITLDPAVSGLTPNADFWLTVEKIVGETTTEKYNGFATEDYKQSLEAGTYKVTVRFTNGDPTITDTVTYASGSVVATVYSGLTTTVKGNLTEVVTYADFGAQQNPDIITTTIGTNPNNPVTQAWSSTSTVEFQTSTAAKVSASMPTSAAQTLISQMEDELDAKKSTSGSATSALTLNLSVNTTEATETTVTYEIGMEATLVYLKKDAQGTDTTTTKSTVETLDKFVDIEIVLRKNLQDVNVTHNVNGVDTAMTACDTLQILNAKTESEDPNGVGFYFYDSVNGKLYIRTYKFSPFKLTYTVPEVVAAIGSETYYSVENAVTAAQAGQTIQLLKDITYDENHSVDLWEKAFNLDLNGHTFETKSGVDKDLSNMGYKASAIVYALEGKVAVKNGTIKTAYGAGIYAAGVELTIEDVVIKAAQTGIQPTDEYSSAVRLTSAATVIINSGSFEAVTAGGHAVAVSNSGGDVVINGGTFKSDLFFSASTNTGVSKTITIKGGDFTNFKVNQGGVDKTAGGLDKGTLVITGGTFDADPSAYVPEGYVVDYNGTTHKWTVSKGNFLIVETGKYYSSLAKVNAAITSSCTVQMLDDYVQNGGIEFLQNKTNLEIVLDLGGHTLAPTSWFDVHNAGGSLTIKNGRFEGNARIYLEVANVHLVLDGIRFDRTDAGKNKFIMFTNGNGTVDVLNCTIIGNNPETDEYLFGNFKGGEKITITNTVVNWHENQWIEQNASYDANKPSYIEFGGTSADLYSDLNIDFTASYETVIGQTSVRYNLIADRDTWVQHCASEYASQDDVNKQITIATAAQLGLLAKNVNEDTTYEGYTITLTANIDLSDYDWMPIGYFDDNSKSFKGTFDGQNHSITGLKNTTQLEHKGVGLFGQVYAPAVIKNLSVSGTIKSNKMYTGGIVGHGYATLLNCSFTGDVSGGLQVGGICGSGGFTITNCTYTGNVSGGCWIGGITGNCQDGGAYTNCTVTGNVKALYVGDINGSVGPAGTPGFAGGGGIAGLVVYRTQVLTDCVFNGTIKESGVVVENKLIGGYYE